MMKSLWTWDELVAAAGARADGAPSCAITGFSNDSRGLAAGEVFVALKDRRDGHDFVNGAFASGASAAIVRSDYAKGDGDGALLRVDDPQRALERIGIAARARLDKTARLIAVTGSVGKTGTKEMLRACLGSLGRTHASEKSFNNHFGVPLTLARMPRDTEFGVFEIGMNHAEEIRPLSKMVRPHAALITTVEAVHLENFASVEGIADAKAEIFDGVLAGGTAIIKHDNPHCERLRAAAQRFGLNVKTFGFSSDADAVVRDLVAKDDGSDVTVSIGQKRFTAHLGIPGVHIAENLIGVIAALDAIGVDVQRAIKPLEKLKPPQGRGARLLLAVGGGQAMLIDESYNANPASMRASLATLGTVSRQKYPRRIAVLGDMLELGPEAAKMHIDLKQAVDEAGVDLVFGCGPMMKGLYETLEPERQGYYAAKARDLEAALVSALRAGDVVMVKGSNGVRLCPLAATIAAHFPPA